MSRAGDTRTSVHATLATDPIPRIDPPSVDEFERDYVRPRRPVVLRALAADWPARRWDRERLRAYPDLAVRVAAVSGGTVVWDEKRGLLHTMTPLGGFIDAIETGRDDRYLMTSLEELPPSLAADLPVPRYCTTAPWKRGVLWMGRAGTVSNLHRDLADNIHVQIAGTKRFVLVSPEYDARVYPSRLWDSVPNGSRVDVERPDYHRFPKLAGVRTQSVELEPGDGLYIPRRWWHHVRTIEHATSVNFWWARGAAAALVLAADRFKRIRGVSR
jgi:hypothetical protein